MTTYYYVWFSIFMIIAIMIVLDPNVGEFVNLAVKYFSVSIKRFFWMMKFHPKNPITNMIKRWEYAKIAKELEKEFSSKINEQ